jgi:hypothetical protein
MTFLIATVTNLIEVIAQIIVAIMMRWLMGISTPESDLFWLHSQPLYWQFCRLRWYRGTEWIHQYRFWRMTHV